MEEVANDRNGFLHSPRLELYTSQRERGRAEVAELRRARKRKCDRCNRQAETPE